MLIQHDALVRLLSDTLPTCGFPARLRDDISHYVLHGQLPHMRIRAAFANDWVAVASLSSSYRFDATTQTKLASLIVQLPAECRGSMNHVNDWIQKGGSYGISHSEQCQS